jgi:p-cumate 2,3-dioxygenase beta subunit
MTPAMTRAAIEDFLYHEAALLDDWKLAEWLALWTADASYLVPATDAPASEPRTALFLIADDLALLRSRVHQLATGSAWAEVPRSRTRRIIGNVRILEHGADAVVAASSFIVHRFRGERSDCFVGTYEHRLVGDGGRLRIQRKLVTLAHETLYEHGKISILL